MAKDKKPLPGREPDYVRALREAKANMPKILDKETGLERDIFSPAPADSSKPKSKVDEFMEKLGHASAKPANNGAKSGQEQRVIIPGWLAQGMDEHGIKSFDLGNLEQILALAALTGVHDGRLVLSLVVRKDMSGVDVAGGEPELNFSEDAQQDIAVASAVLLSNFYPSLAEAFPVCDECKKSKATKTAKVKVPSEYVAKEAAEEKPAKAKKTKSSSKKKTAPKKAA